MGADQAGGAITRRRILVTGGTGALGTSVTRRFLEDGHEVAVSWVVEQEADRLRRGRRDHGGGRARARRRIGRAAPEWV